MKAKIDTTFLIEFKPKFNYTKGDSRYSSSDETLNSNQVLTNSISINNEAIREGKNFTGDLTLNKKYGSNKGFVMLSVENDLNDTENDNFSQCETRIFGDNPQEIFRDQFTDGNQQTNGIEINTSLHVPLVSKKVFMDLEYQFENQNRDDSQFVYDLDQELNSYSLLYVDQSTDFSNIDRTSKPQIGFTYEVEKFRIRLNTGYVFRILESDDALRA